MHAFWKNHSISVLENIVLFDDDSRVFAAFRAGLLSCKFQRLDPNSTRTSFEYTMSFV